MRVTTPGMLVAALAVGAAVPALGMGAAIGLQDDRMGIVAPADVPGRIGMMKATGTRVARVDFLWGNAAPRRPANPTDPDDPAYDWAWADATFGGLIDAGIQPLVTVWSAPAWASGGRSTGQPIAWNANAPRNPKDFANFMQAFAKRFNGRTDIPGQGPVRVRFFEIWNEPNLQLYFRPQYSRGKAVSPGRYARMVNLATPAIKSVNPGAIVIAGVTGPKGRSDRSGRGTLDWITDLKKAGMRRFDAYSQHIYPSAAPLKKTPAVPSWSTLPRVIDAVNTLPGGRRKPVYITEASYTTAVTPYRKVAFTLSQQARYMKQIFTLPVVRSSRVKLVTWFQLQDNPNWPGGLLLNSGGAKPSLASFRSLANQHRPKGSLALP